jgi:alpha-glucuronidase
LETCPEDLLLWFHHVPWDHRTKSGRSLWDELCHRYHRGADAVRDMQQRWETLRPYVDAARYEHVRCLLAIQAKEARWWRDACLTYFQTFSKRPIPGDLEAPEHPLEYYRKIKHHYVPGN